MASACELTRTAWPKPSGASRTSSSATGARAGRIIRPKTPTRWGWGAPSCGRDQPFGSLERACLIRDCDGDASGAIFRWRWNVAGRAAFLNGMIAQVMDQKLLRQYAGAGSNNQIAKVTTFTEPR